MSDQPILRPATLSDAEALTTIARAAYGVYLPRMPHGFRPPPIDADYAEAIERREVLVAERDGRIAGFIVLNGRRDHLLIENVAVAPDAQGRGIGRAPLGVAERRARERDLPALRLYTHVTMVENQRLYARLGYVETRRSTARVFYEKRLRR